MFNNLNYNSQDPFILTKQHVFWFCFGILMAGIVYFLRNAITPFLFSFIFVILFNNIVTKLEKHGVNRMISSFILVFLTFYSIAYIIYIVLPQSYSMILNIIRNIDTNSLTKNGLNILAQNNIIIDNQDLLIQVKNILNDSAKDLFVLFLKTIKESFNSTLEVATIVWLLLLSPMITFFMLSDLPKARESFYSIIPNRYLSYVKSLFTEMQDNVFSYMEGQFIVAIFLTFFYGFILLPFKVKSTFLMGALVGFASFMPYIGFYLATALCLSLTYNQFGDLYHVLLVLGVMLFGQLIETNFVTPKVIGNKIGLHPNWVIFGLFATVPVFGIFGVLFASPISGIVGIFIRHFVAKYKQTKYYVS